MNTKLRDFIVDKLKSTNREGMDDLIKFLDESDFFYAPASTKYHGAYEGGLAEHSVNVLDALLAYDDMLKTTYGMPKEDENSKIIVALLHDVCKINTYKTKTMWRKDNQGKWESYIGYERNPDLAMGHGTKSVFLIQKYIKLTDYEAQAILWHMGPYDISNYMSENEMGVAYSVNGLAYKLNAADMAATYVLENENINWEP